MFGCRPNSIIGSQDHMTKKSSVATIPEPIERKHVTELFYKLDYFRMKHYTV